MLLLGYLILAPDSYCQDPATGVRESSWRKVQYLGGAIGVIGRVETWNNNLIIAPDRIVLQIYRGPEIQIDPTGVATLGYGGKETMREGTGGALLAGGTIFPPSAVAGVIVLLASKPHRITSRSST